MSRRRMTAAVAAAAVLVSAGTALAAQPRPGKNYGGFTSAPAFNGFHPVAGFTVSHSGTKLLHFLYETFGCFGSGGPATPGVDYFIKPWNEHILGTIQVTKSGKFSLKNRKTTYTVQGQKTVTTSTVTGHFKNRSTAVGVIVFSQKLIIPHQTGSSCGPATLHFTAKIRG